MQSLGSDANPRLAGWARPLADPTKLSCNSRSSSGSIHNTRARPNSAINRHADHEHFNVKYIPCLPSVSCNLQAHTASSSNSTSQLCRTPVPRPSKGSTTSLMSCVTFGRVIVKIIPSGKGVRSVLCSVTEHAQVTATSHSSPIADVCHAVPLVTWPSPTKTLDMPTLLPHHDLYGTPSL